MTRRTFGALAAAGAAALLAGGGVALILPRSRRKRAAAGRAAPAPFPGRVTPLDEAAVRRPAGWLG